MDRLSPFVALLLLLAPRAAAAQGPSAADSDGAAEKQSYGAVLQAGAGLQLNGGGSVLSASAGWSILPRVSVLISAERISMPSKTRFYPDGYGVTRGGTLEFISGEVRVELTRHRRTLPYALAGLGRGVSRPTVNEVFTDRVTNDARVVFLGGGVQVPLRSHLNAFADARFLLFTESDIIAPLLPVRAGLAWRF